MDLKFTFPCIFLNFDAPLYLPVVYITVCAGLQPSDSTIRINLTKTHLDKSILLRMCKVYITSGRAA